MTLSHVTFLTVDQKDEDMIDMTTRQRQGKGIGSDEVDYS